MKYILGFIVAFLVLTVCVNAVLSWWISKSVLCPLKKLSLGTKDIRDGNLNTVIDYTNIDEFGEVCRDFDEMRLYLKTSVEQRLKDEQQKKDLITGIYPILFDKDEMKRVLDNLFTNTQKYREAERSSVVISLRRVEHGTVVEFIFSDDGPGVPEESLNRIFDSFYRVDGGRCNSGKGSGIGLAVVKEIIAGHKGIVHAENHGGLTIVIHLPQIPPNEGETK